MLIKIKVFPGSKKPEVIKKSEDKFEIKVREKAERGEANQAAILALAGYFGIPAGKVRLLRGATRSTKIFEIIGR